MYKFVDKRPPVEINSKAYTYLLVVAAAVAKERDDGGITSVVVKCAPT